MTLGYIVVLFVILCSCFAVAFFLREYLDFDLFDLYAFCWFLVIGILTGIAGIAGLYFLITYYNW